MSMSICSQNVDFHSEYGTFFSPRVSALARAGGWTSRLSVGTGFVAPTPLTEETEAAGLTRLEVDGPLEAERGVSASFDLTRSDGPLSYTATVFASRISDPIYVERSPAYVLRQLSDPTTNIGLELLGTFRVVLHRPASVGREPVPSGQRAVFHCRRARREAVRQGSLVRERRKPFWGAADEVGSAVEAVTCG